jgi:hypothetical protein
VCQGSSTSTGAQGQAPQRPENQIGAPPSTSNNPAAPQPAVVAGESEQSTPSSDVQEVQVAPHSKASIALPDFQPERQKLWVGNDPVDPSTIETNDDHTLSFAVPKPARGGSGKTPDVLPVRVSGIDQPAPSGPVLAELHLEKPLPFRQTRAAANLAALSCVVFVFSFLFLLSSNVRAGSTNHFSDTWIGRTVALWFVDPQTNTYSLQRIQFLAWTEAGVFAFAYACYSLFYAQNRTAFPELPSHLIGLLGISGATAFVATGVQNVKGSEGGGAARPQLKDLITTGEVIAIEKVQLLVWTGIGVYSFLFCIMSIDPMKLQNPLPEIPLAILQLAGLSGALYVGGKVVRNPGPVLSQVSVVASQDQRIAIEMRGANLSQDATFSIGDEPIPLTDILDKNGDTHAPEVTVPGKDRESRLVRGLRFYIPSHWVAPKEAATSSKVADRTLAIENPDGQKAETKLVVTKTRATASGDTTANADSPQ